MLTDHPAGCVLAVKAQPGARRAAIVGVHGDALKVAVTAPADQGKANAALIELLAAALGCKRYDVELLSGPTQRLKKFLIHGLKPDIVLAKLLS